MTTTTKSPEQTPAPAARTELPPVDFDTRLELAGIAIDVALSDCDGVQEAQQQAADAVAEAKRVQVPPTHIAAVTEPPVGAVAQRVLNGAAQIIRERGWIQGAFDDPSGALCLWGAIRMASHNIGGEVAELAAIDVIYDRIGHSVSIAGWNDRHGRTVGEVLAVLG